jgi:hypothetical protein
MIEASQQLKDAFAHMLAVCEADGTYYTNIGAVDSAVDCWFGRKDNSAGTWFDAGMRVYGYKIDDPMYNIYIVDVNGPYTYYVLGTSEDSIISQLSAICVMEA